MDPPNPQESYHFIGRGGGQPCHTCLNPLPVYAGLRRLTRLPTWVSLGITAPGKPKLEGNLIEKQACINPTVGHAAPAQPPHKSYPLLFLVPIGTDPQGSVSRSRSLLAEDRPLMGPIVLSVAISAILGSDFAHQIIPGKDWHFAHICFESKSRRELIETTARECVGLLVLPPRDPPEREPYTHCS